MGTSSFILTIGACLDTGDFYIDNGGIHIGGFYIDNGGFYIDNGGFYIDILTMGLLY